MLSVYLTDLQKTATLDLGQGAKDIAQVMALKKIFLSTADLLEPVLPENVSGKINIAQIGWRSTQSELAIFKQLADDWQKLELRLRAYAVFAGREAMDIIVQVAQQQRQARLNDAGTFDANLLEMDVFMLYTVHRQLDQLLAKDKPYATSFLQEWPQFKDMFMQM